VSLTSCSGKANIRNYNGNTLTTLHEIKRQYLYFPANFEYLQPGNTFVTSGFHGLGFAYFPSKQSYF